MPSRQLFENWDSVLLFAFIGTIWNTLAIGLSLFLLGQFNLFSVPFSPFEILLFASLISAVDPVAVIAVFEEIHVNEFLFINVFGEALFNDGVSVVSSFPPILMLLFCLTGAVPNVPQIHANRNGEFGIAGLCGCRLLILCHRIRRHAYWCGICLSCLHFDQVYTKP